MRVADRRLLLTLFAEGGEISLKQWSNLGDDFARRRLLKKAWVKYTRHGVMMTERGGRMLESDPLAVEQMDDFMNGRRR